MTKLSGIKPERVFKYFEEITKIPHGSEDMDKISSYCMDFAEKNSLRAVRDEANNVIIFKSATKGYEESEPVILQGHLDMVCQKEPGNLIDFKKDGLRIYVDGNFVKADGTTLGADNGIAVAMILAILESDEYNHPAIEAVFTTDEEIGMIGAGKLDTSLLSGRKMINLDAEEPDTLTVSCAGGSDFKLTIPTKRKKAAGKMVEINIKGLKGGHSGIEINSGRINANILAGRILDFAKTVCDFEMIDICGGDKGNAIPLACKIRLVVPESEAFAERLQSYFEVIKQEYADGEEKGIKMTAEVLDDGEYDVIDSAISEKLIYILLTTPNGVQKMSEKIEGLVETSLNLGILNTEADEITMLFTLRSNKKSALEFLEKKMKTFVSVIEGEVETSGHYPPWEFNADSKMQGLYKKVFSEKFGYEPTVVAIHAGLECGIFSSMIKNLDCIAIGPQLHDVHTVKERLSISSTQEIFDLVLKMLESCR